jgi:hypothetical protein
MPNSNTINFKLSDSDLKAVVDSSGKRVKLSAKGLAEAKTTSFIPWNCRFDECRAPSFPTRKSS